MSFADADNLLIAAYRPDVSYVVIIASNAGRWHCGILGSDGYFLLGRWHHHGHHVVGGGVNSGRGDF